MWPSCSPYAMRAKRYAAYRRLCARIGDGPHPGPERVRVAVNDEDVVVGFCRLQDDVNGIAYVNPIVTYSAWRGYGVGRALIEDARDLAGELRLIARGTSEGFYRKLGFVECLGRSRPRGRIGRLRQLPFPR